MCEQFAGQLNNRTTEMENGNVQTPSVIPSSGQPMRGGYRGRGGPPMMRGGFEGRGG